MKVTTSIKCSECGTITYNSDHCSNCGALINIDLKRRMVRDKKVQEKVLAERERKRGKSEIFAERALEHPNFIVRSFSKAVRSIFLFFGMVVGGIIAAIIALASG